MFTDDYSRLGYVYLIKYKSKAFEKFKEFKNEVEKQIGKSIKILRSNWGGEYLSIEFLEYLKKHDILSQWTPPGTPQLNGVSERRNRTLMDMVRSMMSYTDLPVSFWGYALQTAVYLLNKVPSNSMPRTPYEMWFGRKPSLNHLKIWGCPAYVKKHDIDKLDARSEMCRCNGYPKENTTSTIQTNKRCLLQDLQDFLRLILHWMTHVCKRLSSRKSLESLMNLK